MATLNKEFQYGGHRFNIKVELNYIGERYPGGVKGNTGSQ